MIEKEKKIYRNLILLTVGAGFYILSSLDFLGKIYPLPTDLTYLSVFAFITIVLFIIASISLRRMDKSFSNTLIYSVAFLIGFIAVFVLLYFPDNDICVAITEGLNFTITVFFFFAVFFALWEIRKFLQLQGAQKVLKKGFFITIGVLQIATFVFEIILDLDFLLTNYFFTISVVYLNRGISLALSIIVFMGFMESLMGFKSLKKEGELNEKQI